MSESKKPAPFVDFPAMIEVLKRPGCHSIIVKGVRKGRTEKNVIDEVSYIITKVLDAGIDHIIVNRSEDKDINCMFLYIVNNDKRVVDILDDLITEIGTANQKRYKETGEAFQGNIP